MSELVTQLPEWDKLPDYNPPVPLSGAECTLFGVIGGIILSCMTAVPIAIIAHSERTGYIISAAIIGGIILCCAILSIMERRDNKQLLQDSSKKLRVDVAVEPGRTSAETALCVSVVNHQGGRYCSKKFGAGEDLLAQEYMLELQAAIDESYEEHQQQRQLHADTIKEFQSTRSMLLESVR